MTPDDFFAAVEHRMEASSPYLRRMSGFDVPPYDPNAPKSSPSIDNLLLFRQPSEMRRWKKARLCDRCGVYSTDWPPAYGAHHRSCKGNA